MDAISRTAFVIAIVAAALLFLLFGGGMATGTMLSGGVMGSEGAGGIIWMWLPALLVVVLGVIFLGHPRKELRQGAGAPEVRTGRRGRFASRSRHALVASGRQ